MTMRQVLRWVAVGVSAVLATTACSSTDTVGLDAAAAPSADSVDDPAGAADGLAARDTNARDDAGAAARPSSAASGRRSSAPANRTEQVAGRSVTVSHGVSDGKIKIGIAWADASQAGTAIGAIGGPGGRLGDGKVQSKAVVDYINARGGIAGLAIEPVYHQYNVSNLVTASGRAAEAQAECSAWTEDTQVFAMLAILTGDQILLDCAAKTNTPILSSVIGQTADQTQFDQTPNLLYSPSGVTVDAREKFQVDRMTKAGVLTPKSKVGVLIEGNSPMNKRAADRTLFPELKRHRVPVVSQIVYPDFIDSPWDSYVLQFRQAGVDTVYMGNTEGGIWALSFFARAASNQRWYPTFVVSSDHKPAIVSGLVPDEAPGFRGAGWKPNLDTGETEPLSENGRICTEIMHSVGQPDYDTTSQGVGYCETLFFLRDALAGSRNITPEGLAAGAAALGSRFPAILTRTPDFSGGVHYATNVVQEFVYNRDCSCMVYVGKPAALR